MNNISKLTRIDFCNLENSSSDAVGITWQKYFQDKDGKTAHHYAGNYLQTITITPYLAWTGDIYPKFKLEEINLESIPESESINE
jgi:hypothetical protein